MATLGKEARALQNPACGAVLLWAFCSEYYDSHPTHNGAPLPLTFIVVPMVLHESTRQMVLGTNPSSGLRFFAEKFSSSNVSQSDVMATLQRRVRATRQLTMESLQLLLRCDMGTIDIESGSVIPSKTRGLGTQIPVTVDPLVKAAKKLGRWTSALTMYEVAATLGLAF
jgi:hypothetical protein